MKGGELFNLKKHNDDFPFPAEVYELWCLRQFDRARDAHRSCRYAIGEALKMHVVT